MDTRLKRRAAAGAAAGALGGVVGYLVVQQVRLVLGSTAGPTTEAAPGTDPMMTALRLLLAVAAAFLVLWWTGVPGAVVGIPIALILHPVIEVLVKPATVDWIAASPVSPLLDALPPDGLFVFAALFAAVMAVAVAVGSSAMARDESAMMR